MRRWRAASLRRRLLWQTPAPSAHLAASLFFAVRVVAKRASRASQDAVLGATARSIADGMQGIGDGLDMDLPWSLFLDAGRDGG